MSGRTPCRYGSSCYQSHPDHRLRFSHPASHAHISDDVIYVGSRSADGAASSSNAVAQTGDAASIALAWQLSREEDRFLPSSSRSASSSSPSSFSSSSSPFGGGDDAASIALARQLSRDGDCEPRKRQRTADASAFVSDGIGFWLCRTPLLGRAHNERSVSLGELFNGSPRWCLLSNYMFDGQWLLTGA